MSTDSREQPSAGEMRAYACRLLGRREYSVRELALRLQRKWPALPADRLDDVLTTLAGENLLSDRRFAEAFVRSHVQKSQGPLRIRAALRAKGVADALIAEELDRHVEEWVPLARDWLQRQHPGELDYATRGKFYRRLLNRGFSHDQAMDALNAAD